MNSLRAYSDQSCRQSYFCQVAASHIIYSTESQPNFHSDFVTTVHVECFFVIYVNGTASIVINVYSIYCIYATDSGYERF